MLVYIPTWEIQIQHIAHILWLLHDQELFMKHSKSAFGVTKVEYLGHNVSHDGVRVDPKKVKSMKNWPHPKNIKSLREFLGLIGYYLKFSGKLWEDCSFYDNIAKN